jgi:hypothetical protein
VSLALALATVHERVCRNLGRTPGFRGSPSPIRCRRPAGGPAEECGYKAAALMGFRPSTVRHSAFPFCLSSSGSLAKSSAICRASSIVMMPVCPAMSVARP